MSLKNVLITLFCLLALNSNGQYELLIKGQSVNFDSAVAVRLDVYRMETIKLEMGSRLIDSLQLLISFKNQELESKTSLVDNLQLQTGIMQSRLIQRDSINDQLQRNFILSNQIAMDCLKDRPKKWLLDPKTWGLGGVLILIAVKTLTNGR